MMNMSRNRALLFLLLLSVFFSSTYFLFMSRAQRSTIHSMIVEETKTQIDNLKKNFDDDGVRKLVVDEAFMEEFALDDHKDDARYFDVNRWSEDSDGRLPALVVTAVTRGDAGQAAHFVRNVLLFLPDAKVVLYDMGLGYYESELVTKYCNSTSCAIRKFDYGPYPGHVDRLGVSAARPLIIKKCLLERGSLLWLDVSQRLTSKELAPFLRKASRSGLLAWAMATDGDGSGGRNRRPLLPTSALTHPNMFVRLGVSRPDELEEYHFQHMVGLDALVVYHTRAVADGVLAPWVKCALLADCVEPVGAQSTGCTMDKKPQYRYVTSSLIPAEC